MQLSENQRYLLSSGKDATVKVWDLRTGAEMLRFFTSPAQLKSKSHPCFSWNEDFIYTSEPNSPFAVSVWNARTGENVQRLPGHNNSVRWIESSPVQNEFITCSTDHRARFWANDK